MTEEIWKDIEGFEGKYQVSNKGNVKSLKYNKSKKEMIMKPSKNKHGYLQVHFRKKGFSKYYRIHRLVIETFMGKPANEEYYSVNHIDENKENNNLDNLQYCTITYNNIYGTRLEKYSKPVIGINQINGYIIEFQSTSEAGRILNIDTSSITKCCKGKRKYAGGYKWMYANSNDEEVENK